MARGYGIRAVASAMAHGIGALTTSISQDIERGTGNPGPEIKVAPIAPGSDTPGTILAKLGTTLFAAARTRANARAATAKADSERQYRQAQIDKLTRVEPTRPTYSRGGIDGLTPGEALNYDTKQAKPEEQLFDYRLPNGQTVKVNQDDLRAWEGQTQTQRRFEFYRGIALETQKRLAGNAAGLAIQRSFSQYAKEQNDLLPNAKQAAWQKALAEVPELKGKSPQDLVKFLKKNPGILEAVKTKAGVYSTEAYNAGLVALQKKYADLFAQHVAADPAAGAQVDPEAQLDALVP